MASVHDVKAQVDKHEAVCAERYAGINAQLKRIERWFVAMVGSTGGLMAAVILKML